MLHFTSFMDYNYNLFDLLYYPYIHDNNQGPLKIVINAIPTNPTLLCLSMGPSVAEKQLLTLQ